MDHTFWQRVVEHAVNVIPIAAYVWEGATMNLPLVRHVYLLAQGQSRTLCELISKSECLKAEQTCVFNANAGTTVTQPFHPLVYSYGHPQTMHDYGSYQPSKGSAHNDYPLALQPLARLDPVLYPFVQLRIVGQRPSLDDTQRRRV
jgi:hypothetical protein